MRAAGSDLILRFGPTQQQAIQLMIQRTLLTISGVIPTVLSKQTLFALMRPFMFKVMLCVALYCVLIARKMEYLTEFTQKSGGTRKLNQQKLIVLHLTMLQRTPMIDLIQSSAIMAVILIMDATIWVMRLVAGLVGTIISV